MQQRYSILLSPVALALSLVLVPSFAQEVAPVEAAPKAVAKVEKSASPMVEVVFVLDTTGSMGGLIAAAKEKVWAIANTLATAKPAPDIKMGLVAYRDRSDEYVTKKTDLTADLDAIYAQLMSFTAGGGGDTPESVNQALNEAVTQMKWSTDESTLRLLFLVGDAPPHMDYADDVKYQKTCELAARGGIFINSIQCGGIGATEPIWRDIALKAEGRYFRVEQSGGHIVRETPFDERLAALSLELDKTRVYYGDAKLVQSQLARADRTYATKLSSSKRAQAQWCVFNCGGAGGKNFLGSNELCHDVETGKVKLAEVKKKDLPETLRKLKPEELEKLVKTNLGTRKKLQTEVVELGKKRQLHLEKQLANEKKEPGLDNGIFKCIQDQAKRRGITYEGGPKL